MKSKLIFTICLFWIINGFTSDLTPFQYSKELGLLGKVKSARVVTYEAKFENGEIVPSENYSDEGFFKEQIFEFNRNGYISNIYFYLSEIGLSSKETYNYDDKGNMIEEIKYSFSDLITLQFEKIKTNFKTSSEREKQYSIFIDTIMPRFFDSTYTANLPYRDRLIYSYNGKNQITEANYYTYDSTAKNRNRQFGKELYAYDDIGRLRKTYGSNKKVRLSQKYKITNGFTEIEKIHEPGCRSSHEYLTLDENSNIIKEYRKPIKYMSDYPKTYKYDGKNKLIEEVTTKGRKKIIEKKSYKYDEAGNLVEEKIFNSDYKSGLLILYKYKFDNNNNWIERIKFIDEMPESITVRTIDYYE